MTVSKTLATVGVTAEVTAIRRRTRRGVGVSFVAHALLLVFLKLTAPDPTEVEGLVEVTWIEAPTPAPPPAPAPPVATARVTRASTEGRDVPAKPAPRPERKRFVREMTRSTTAPNPQVAAASRDVVRERLASLTRSAADSRTQIAALLPTAETPRTTLASAPAPREDEPSPRSLTRGESRSTPVPAELVRAAVAPAPMTTALARIVEEPPAPSPPPTASDAMYPARDLQAGVSLAGPVADRKLVRSRLPTYPEWAKQDAVEGTVRLRFVVRPDGGVRESILIEKTSGYEDFDRNATLALLDWRFEPLPGSTGDQWGTITLDYRLDSLR